MTQAQIGSIIDPANGLLVFCTTDNKMYIYVSTDVQWKEVTYGTGTITPGFLCGGTITISHMEGSVAPAAKTVTYGTVSNIPGEPSKCWITSNLGADHQATAVNDATEASAGWYWQFNRSQGYKHDGATIAPNTTWITSINENLDWLSANDPCALELGIGWRIPTITEWTNVDVSGSWNDWNGPYGSALKLHAAGYLNDNNGSLQSRGVLGPYWSSTQINGISGGCFYFLNSYSDPATNFKAFGSSIRCIKELY